jgi:hypothetical protein
MMILTDQVPAMHANIEHSRVDYTSSLTMYQEGIEDVDRVLTVLNGVNSPSCFQLNYCVADVQPAPPNAAFAPKAHRDGMSKKTPFCHPPFMLSARLVQSSRWKMGLRPRIFGPATAVAAGGGVDTVTRLVT